MDFITDYFSGKDTIFIISQVIGIIAAALLLLSYQQKTHKGIVTMQIFSGLLFSVQYFMIGAYEGLAGNIVGMLRGCAFYFRGKSKLADSIICPTFFAVLGALAGAVTYTSPASLLPMAAIIISSFVLWNTKTQQLRILTFPTSFMWLIYNIICSSYSGIITEVLNEISIAIGLFRFRNKKENKRG